MPDQSFSRRHFLQLSASAAAMLGLGGCNLVKIGPSTELRKPRPIAAGAKIRVAQIGFAGKGFSDVRGCKDEEIVALCDVDWSLEKVQETFKEFPNAKRYKDFRQMLLEMDDEIDAVNISTPDHMHFLPAYMAIAMGKHVYVQKPLTQTVGEARELLRMARLHGVVTQMGNQGHAGEGIRLMREWVQGGLIGPVREVHVWTNRPVWPQGMAAMPAAETPNADLDWDKWIGRAHTCAFNKEIHPFKWRGYREFGAGALGDMGCHTLDAAFWALELGAPTSVEAVEIQGLTDVAFPTGTKIVYQFPARGQMPPVTLTWYDGSCKPPRPAGLEKGRELSNSGQLLVGEKGSIYDGTDYCNSPRLIPEAKMKEMRDKLPAKTIPRVPNSDPHKEWLTAIRENNPTGPGSNFEYSVPMTEMVLLGNVALLAGGKIEWDSKKMRVTNNRAANKYVNASFRRGWKPEDMV